MGLKMVDGMMQAELGRVEASPGVKLHKAKYPSGGEQGRGASCISGAGFPSHAGKDN